MTGCFNHKIEGKTNNIINISTDGGAFDKIQYPLETRNRKKLPQYFLSKRKKFINIFTYLYFKVYLF